MDNYNYPLHRLGWQAFQDLCVAVVEERTGRAVQTFLPSNDAGRDGAFLGRWEKSLPGQSTIQCKFTSKERSNLTLSMLMDELPKAKKLAEAGLADDYIILTNHVVTGTSELKIRQRFEEEGIKCCRVFHNDWIASQIAMSARLRMMMPRLYGMVDLSSIFDARAYKQAQLVLSEMGESLQKLVVTEAHRNSVRAISEHSLVLLLGSPAAGKSTIGASLALGATDTWGLATIKSTSPDHLEKHIDPDGGQFFWIDDAWGSTQYQRDRVEKWNQVFPLIHGAMRQGTKFLITSRDYIWAQAKKELKLSALPVLSKSQVVINVQELSVNEKARILYNHLKLGDQDKNFLRKIAAHLSKIARSNYFLPESARRLGTKFFTQNIKFDENVLEDFFTNPKEFLEQTISSLTRESRAAIALIFLNGGTVRSPVNSAELEIASNAFGVAEVSVREQLNILNGSILNFVEDEYGHFWTYHHPTVGDAFASYVAKDPELIELYLKGANSRSIVNEVVCAGVKVSGASVIVPNSMHSLLIERIKKLPTHVLRNFISYRSNAYFSKDMLIVRPDLVDPLPHLVSPIKEDSDILFLSTLSKQGNLSEKSRLKLIEAVRESVVEKADPSFLTSVEVRSMLTEDQRIELIEEARIAVLCDLEAHIDRVVEDWSENYNPEYHFDDLRESLNFLSDACYGSSSGSKKMRIDELINEAIISLQDRYAESNSYSNGIPVQQSAANGDALDELFRDVHE